MHQRQMKKIHKSISFEVSSEKFVIITQMAKNFFIFRKWQFYRLRTSQKSKLLLLLALFFPIARQYSCFLVMLGKWGIFVVFVLSKLTYFFMFMIFLVYFEFRAHLFSRVFLTWKKNNGRGEGRKWICWLVNNREFKISPLPLSTLVFLWKFDFGNSGIDHFACMNTLMVISDLFWWVKQKIIMFKKFEEGRGFKWSLWRFCILCMYLCFFLCLSQSCLQISTCWNRMRPGRAN